MRIDFNLDSIEFGTIRLDIDKMAVSELVKHEYKELDKDTYQITEVHEKDKLRIFNFGILRYEAVLAIGTIEAIDFNLE